MKVTANAAWSVRSEAAWLSFAPEGGDAGTSTVTISAERNQTGAERPATVEFLIDGEVIATLDVKQSGEMIQYAPSPLNLTELDASATVLTFGWDEPAEATHKYQAALFTDKEGEPVQQSPEFTLDAKFPAPIFTFGGLEPSTAYQAGRADRSAPPTAWRIHPTSSSKAARPPRRPPRRALWSRCASTA